jgi:hypothetical protein
VAYFHGRLDVCRVYGLIEIWTMGALSVTAKLERGGGSAGAAVLELLSLL